MRLTRHSKGPVQLSRFLLLQKGAPTGQALEFKVNWHQAGNQSLELTRKYIVITVHCNYNVIHESFAIRVGFQKRVLKH